MQKEIMKDTLAKCIDNIIILGSFEHKLASVIPFTEAKGITIHQLMNKLTVGMQDNWHKSISSEMSKSSEYKHIDGSYYGKLADLAANDIVEIFDKTVTWDETSLNELRIAIRLYISNLVKSLDVFTGIFNAFETSKTISKIRTQGDIDEEKNAKLDKLLKQSAVSYDASVALSEAIPEKDKTQKVFNIYGSYMIKSNLLLDDIITRMEYEDSVCDQAKSALEPFSYSLSVHDAKSIMDIKDSSEQTTAAMHLADILSAKDVTISLIQDYESMYLEATEDSVPAIRDMSVSSIPVEIINKTILAKKPTQELLDFIFTDKITEEIPTEEF